MLIPVVHPKLAVLLDKRQGLGFGFLARRPRRRPTKHKYREIMDVEATGANDTPPDLPWTSDIGYFSCIEIGIDHLELSVLVTTLEVATVLISAS